MIREIIEIVEGKKPKLDKEVQKILNDMDKLLDLDTVVLKGKDSKLIKSKEEAKIVSPKEADKIEKGKKKAMTLKDALANTLPEFKQIKNFSVKNGKFTIDGIHKDGSSVYKELDMGSDVTGIQKIVNALNKKIVLINKSL